ncbi:MAG: response regulator transcription factor [Actinomycetota bacterium]
MCSPVNTKGEILLVEDDRNIAGLVQMYLEREGFRVVHASSGEEALELAASRPPTMVLLDIGLPGIDGIEVCRRLRASSGVAIMMLTARDSEIDRVVGLEIGADDYVTKPFSPREVVARVKAILRRVEPAPAGTVPLSAGEVTLWPDRREVAAGDRPVQLTAKQFDLLRFLIENRGMVLARSQILSGVWGYDFYGGERTIDAHIRTIRKLLGDALPLVTIRGVGYKIESGPRPARRPPSPQ